MPRLMPLVALFYKDARKRADLVLHDLDVPEWRPLLDPVNSLVEAATGASVRAGLAVRSKWTRIE